MYSLSPASYARFRSLQIVQSISMPAWRFAGPIVAEILTMCRIIVVGWATPQLPEHSCAGHPAGQMRSYLLWLAFWNFESRLAYSFPERIWLFAMTVNFIQWRNRLPPA